MTGAYNEVLVSDVGFRMFRNGHIVYTLCCRLENAVVAEKRHVCPFYGCGD